MQLPGLQRLNVFHFVYPGNNCICSSDWPFSSVWVSIGLNSVGSCAPECFVNMLNQELCHDVGFRQHQKYRSSMWASAAWKRWRTGSATKLSPASLFSFIRPMLLDRGLSFSQLTTPPHIYHICPEMFAKSDGGYFLIFFGPSVFAVLASK